MMWTQPRLCRKYNKGDCIGTITLPSLFYTDMPEIVMPTFFCAKQQLFDMIYILSQPGNDPPPLIEERGVLEYILGKYSLDRLILGMFNKLLAHYNFTCYSIVLHGNMMPFKRVMWILYFYVYITTPFTDELYIQVRPTEWLFFLFFLLKCVTSLPVHWQNTVPCWRPSH